MSPALSFALYIFWGNNRLLAVYVFNPGAIKYLAQEHILTAETGEFIMRKGIAAPAQDAGNRSA